MSRLHRALPAVVLLVVTIMSHVAFAHEAT